MNRLFLYLLLFSSIPLFHLMAADNNRPELATFLITPKLTENANSVVREYTEILNISNNHNATAQITKTITLLNDNAAELATIRLPYDKLNKISNISANMYDANGKLIRTLKSKEWTDVPAYSQINLMTDTRLLHCKLLHSTYPYTISYSYTNTYNGYMSFYYLPFNDEYQSIQNATYKVICTDRNNLNYFCENIQQEAETTDKHNSNVWEWNFKNINYTEIEVLSGNFYDNTPYIKIIPQKFSLDDYDGSNETWKTYGEWCYSLWKQKDQLPQEALDEIHSQINDRMTVAQKVAAIYRYVQDRSRYVSIQLGIGGWRPFSAEYVHKNQYGDCKALTNYTMAALRSVGVVSYPALINAEEVNSPTSIKYPHSQFNHVILCVPDPSTKDTIWLECTSSELKAGQLASICSNKPVLLFSEAGGKLTKTPPINHNHNRLLINSQLQIDSIGNMAGNLQLRTIGLQQALFSAPMTNNNPKDVSLWLQENLESSNASVIQSNFAQLRPHTDTLTAEMQIQIKGNRNIGGKRLFFSPAIFSVGNYYNLPTLEKDKQRQKDIYLYEEFNDEMDIVVDIPKGWTVESLPDALHLQHSFGSYTAQYRYDEIRHCITLHSTMEMNTPIIEAAKYQELRNFYEQIRKNRQQNVVLVK